MKPLLYLLALAVSFSTAGDPTATGDVTSSGTSSWQGSDYEHVYWSQLPTGISRASQYFTDYYPDLDAGVADDFQFTVFTTINKIRWWGYYWNGTCPYPIDAPVEIYLYLDDGSGNAPTLPQHSSAIQSWMIPAGYYDEVPDGSNYRCEFDFPTWVTFSAGVRYWFEIRKAYAFDPFGQYGWVEFTSADLGPCVQGFDGLGIAWWTPQDNGAAFELIFDTMQMENSTSMEASTWAEIKTIF